MIPRGPGMSVILLAQSSILETNPPHAEVSMVVVLAPQLQGHTLNPLSSQHGFPPTS